MNDLFEIKLIFLRSKSYVAIFSICMDAKLFGMRRPLLIDATDISKISSDQNRIKPVPPFIFREHGKINNNHTKVPVSVNIQSCKIPSRPKELCLRKNKNFVAKID